MVDSFLCYRVRFSGESIIVYNTFNNCFQNFDYVFCALGKRIIFTF